jgi:hypothetical protein
MQHGETYSLLGDIAAIRTGVTFKNSIEELDAGNLHILLPRDIVDGQLRDNPPMIDQRQVNGLDTHLLNPGDILLANKGTKFSVFLYQDSPPRAVATSSFFVISPKPKILIPEFLYWYLNQPLAKAHLQDKSSGSTIPSITKGIVGKLQIPQLPIRQQKWLVEILSHAERERQLLRQLIERKTALVDNYAWEFIKNSQ